MKIYNSLTREKEDFIPLHGKDVKIYVCGLTVYDLAHLGHAKLYISFDIIIRYLKFLGYNTTYIRNITDIDDKIIKRANELSITTQDLSAKYIKEMHEDFANLGLMNPDYEPKATEHIQDIIDIIKDLIDKKCAYISKSGDVYFNVKSFSGYGKLSRRDMGGQRAGERVEVSSDKHSPEDFVLWKMSKQNEPSWESPWGYGRPGWHIECSAMSMKYLGEYFDIHGGGYDLLFPHHENELAQSCASTGNDFVKYWMHIGYLTCGKEKMAKSLGNFSTVRELLDKYHPETIRLFIAMSHYRSQQNFSQELLYSANAALFRLYNAVENFAPKSSSTNNLDSPYMARFIDAMNDDFNTGKAISIMFELAHEITTNKHLDQATKEQNINLLYEFGSIIGILRTNHKDFFQYGFSNEEKQKIEILLGDRKLARKNKEWSKADSIRDTLNDMNVEVEDTPLGSIWKRKIQL